VLAANVLLGVSQGLTWSTTVIMKIDLGGSRQRGLAMGFNECAGYVALAASALATGWIAARYGLRPQPFYLGVGFAIIGLALSALLVRETRHHVSHESALVGRRSPEPVPTAREVFWRTSVVDANLSSVSQAGLVNNLNDGMAWGLFPLVFAAAGMSLAPVVARIGGRRVSPLARSRVCDRRGTRGCHGRRVRTGRRHVGHRGTDLCVGGRIRHQNGRNVAPSSTQRLGVTGMPTMHVEGNDVHTD
jgi:MFS family permease